MEISQEHDVHPKTRSGKDKGVATTHRNTRGSQKFHDSNQTNGVDKGKGSLRASV